MLIGLRPGRKLATFHGMSSTEDIVSLSREELLALVAELRRQVTLLHQQVAGLTDSNQELRGEVDRLTRQSKRQAAPFSKGTRSKQPRRPGRKPGEGRDTVGELRNGRGHVSHGISVSDSGRVKP
jgi:regulator of replication initiation timing